MKQISLWAYNHKWSARISIVLLWILLHSLAWLLSGLIDIPPILTKSGSIFLSIAVLILFYEAALAGKRHTYLKRKMLDGALALTTFLLLFFSSGDRLSQGQANAIASVSTIIPAKQYLEKSKIETQKKSPLLKKWKKIRHYTNLIQKELSKDESTKKTLLIILTILLGLAALILVMALSCSISCNGGGEGAALAVLILGGGGIIFLVYKIIQRINRGPRKKIQEEPSL